MQWPSGPLLPLPALSFCRRRSMRPREDSDSCKVKARCAPAEPRSLDSKGIIRALTSGTPSHYLLGFALSVPLSLPLFSSCLLSSGLLSFSLQLSFFKFYSHLCFPYSYSLVFSASSWCLRTQSIHQCQLSGPLDRSSAPVEGYPVYLKERIKLLKVVTSRRKISSPSPNLQYRSSGTSLFLTLREDK